MTGWLSFHCESPDFKIKSIPDDVTFAVNRTSLQASEVFRDMFSCCDTNPDITEETDDQVLELHETAGILVALFRVLHYPPAPPVLLCSDGSEKTQIDTSQLPKKHYDPATVIPFPIIIVLYGLVDKYTLSRSISESLDAHLLANAPIYPLEVYGHATIQGAYRTASEASQYIMPLATYSTNEIKNIPSVEAYHKIVRLQDLRIKVLRSLVLGEEIFPHGYGSCPSHHQEITARWNKKRQSLALKIETITDVAGEMATLLDALPKGCQICHKACSAAVSMLAYKCRKAPRRIDQLPTED